MRVQWLHSLRMLSVDTISTSTKGESNSAGAEEHNPQKFIAKTTKLRSWRRRPNIWRDTNWNFRVSLVCSVEVFKTWVEIIAENSHDSKNFKHLAGISTPSFSCSGTLINDLYVITGFFSTSCLNSNDLTFIVFCSCPLRSLKTPSKKSTSRRQTWRMESCNKSRLRWQFC